MVPADAGSLYADKAYDTKVSHAWLRERGIDSQIAKRARTTSNSPRRIGRRTGAKSRVRGGIERIFAHWKQWQHYRRVRYLGLAKNQLELTLKAVAYNLKRLAGILIQRSARNQGRTGAMDQ
ncbi:MAG: transposase [Verrucomicrobia bacterium]|nr:transposase [Verrucomicrobiota bacterium]